MASIAAASRVPDVSLDFVYIDGCHQYENVLQDIYAWLPKIRYGGMLAGHDLCPVWPGVVQAVNEFISQTKYQLCHGRNSTESVDDWWVKV